MIPRSRYRSYPGDTPITLCFFDGPLGAPLPIGGREYDRYALTIGPNGEVRLVAAGHRDSMVVAPQLP